MKVQDCKNCEYCKRKTWSTYYKPNNYHAIGVSHAYAYCDKYKKRVSKFAVLLMTISFLITGCGSNKGVFSSYKTVISVAGSHGNARRAGTRCRGRCRRRLAVARGSAASLLPSQAHG